MPWNLLRGLVTSSVWQTSRQLAYATFNFIINGNLSKVNAGLAKCAACLSRDRVARINKNDDMRSKQANLWTSETQWEAELIDYSFRKFINFALSVPVSNTGIPFLCKFSFQRKKRRVRRISNTEVMYK